MEKKLEILFEECKKEQNLLKIPYSKNIRRIALNRRAKSRFGSCKAIKKGRITIAYEIDISTDVMNCDDKDIKCIIHHELLHTCKGCMNHGEKWKQYAATLNKTCGYEISRVTSYENMGLDKPIVSKNPKYIIKCTGCGAEIYRYRKCNLVEKTVNYRCGKCGSSLKLQ